MRIKKTIKREIEEEILDKQLCDNCKKEIEYADACGYGAEYHLTDRWCSGCGGESWDFCNLNCLIEFVNKLSAEKRGLTK